METYLTIAGAFLLHSDRQARELKVRMALAADLLACRRGQAVKARGDAG